MKKVLHVGCGAATIANMTPGFQQGWREVRFDINPGVRPDIVGTIADMRGVADNSVDAVYSSHNIEHVHSFQVIGVLREFRRVLTQDGFLVVTCPDVQSVAAQVAQGRLTDPLYTSPTGPICAIDILYGHVDSIRNGEEYMAHRTAFTLQSLIDALKGAGFATIGARRRETRYDLWALATKSKVDASRTRELASQFFPAA